jgi:hypothetical protein
MKTNHLEYPVLTKTLSALRRMSPALATRFQQETAHATKLTLQPAAEYFWEGTGQDFAEWHDFPPLRLPAVVVWDEWTMPARRDEWRGGWLKSKRAENR